MTTIFLNAVFKPFLKSSMTRANNWRSIWTNFLTDGFLQIIQLTGFASVNTQFQIPPKEKITRWKIGRSRGPRHVSETGNELPGKWVARETCFKQWSLTRLQCALWHHLVETTHWHSPPSSAYLLSTTHSKDVMFPWVTLYKQFARCQVPVGDLYKQFARM